MTSGYNVPLYPGYPNTYDLGGILSSLGKAIKAIPDDALSGIGSAVGGAVGGAVSNGYSSGVSKATTGLESLPGVLQPIISAGQRIAPAVGALSGGSKQTQQVQPIQQSTGTDMQGVNALNLMLAQEVLNGNISATEANAVLSLLGMDTGGEKAMSANQSKAAALQGSLDNLRGVWESAGGGARTMETLGLNIGTGARTLDQAKAAVAEDLGRLQSQGAINEQERVAFLQRLPNVWDSPEVVEQKFASIQNIINSYR